MKNYSREFFASRHQRTLYSANEILSIVLQELAPIRSAVDVGCGVGTWLSVLKNLGVVEICGLDGHWVDKDLLEIPQDCFVETDLQQPIKLGKKYELAISLEVAEHLSSDYAEEFVNSLAKLSNTILFSAAIPFQGRKGI